MHLSGQTCDALAVAVGLLEDHRFGKGFAMAVTNTYTVTGMTCSHCVQAVTGEIETLPGVTDVQVDLATGQVRVTSDDPLPDDAVRTAVDEAGYQVANA